MADSFAIDLSIANIWNAWMAFRMGKRPTQAIILNEKKRRDLAEASVRDRVVHRLLYNYVTDEYARLAISQSLISNL